MVVEDPPDDAAEAGKDVAGVDDAVSMSVTAVNWEWYVATLFRFGSTTQAHAASQMVADPGACCGRAVTR